MSSTITPMDAASRMASMLRAAGWDIEFINLDLTSDTPKATIKVMRSDGRWLFASVDQLGRATIDRFQRNRVLGRTPSVTGRAPLSPQINDTFLGRERFMGARSMMRGLTSYLVDNALHPVTLTDMRAGWAAIMAAPLRIESPAVSI